MIASHSCWVHRGHSWYVRYIDPKQELEPQSQPQPAGAWASTPTAAGESSDVEAAVAPEPPPLVCFRVSGRRRTDGGKVGLPGDDGRNSGFKGALPPSFKSAVRVFSAVLEYRCIKVTRGVEFEPSVQCRPPRVLLRLLSPGDGDRSRGSSR